MLKYVSYHEKMIRFQERFSLNQSSSYFIDGLMSFKNLPEFAQLENGSLFFEIFFLNFLKLTLQMVF